MVTYEQPYGKPAAPEQIVITIRLGEGMNSPRDVRAAVDDAMYVYSGAEELRPFAMQPGFPQGEIKHPLTGVVVGEWKITS